MNIKKAEIKKLIIEAAQIIECEYPRFDPRYETAVKLRKLVEEQNEHQKSNEQETDR
jgi:hypothetical protein